MATTKHTEQPDKSGSRAASTVQFKDLAIGDTFDFIGLGSSNSFFNRCTKVSPRGYTWIGIGARVLRSNVGTKHATVFHVERAAK